MHLGFPLGLLHMGGVDDDSRDNLTYKGTREKWGGTAKGPILQAAGTSRVQHRAVPAPCTREYRGGYYTTNFTQHPNGHSPPTTSGSL